MRRITPAVATSSSRKNKYSKAKGAKFTIAKRCKMLLKNKSMPWLNYSDHLHVVQ